MMGKRTKTIFLGGLVLLLVALNVQLALAHRRNGWIWHQNGQPIRYWLGSPFTTQAQAAINDWNACSGFALTQRSSHTDTSVFAANYGRVWLGLSNILAVEWDWWCPGLFCGIDHVHAIYNTYYSRSSSTIQGVFCQEIGHNFGLGHSPHGCMGLGYYTTIAGNSTRVNRAHSCPDLRAYTH